MVLIKEVGGKPTKVEALRVRRLWLDPCPDLERTDSPALGSFGAAGHGSCGCSSSIIVHDGTLTMPSRSFTGHCAALDICTKLGKEGADNIETHLDDTVPFDCQYFVGLQPPECKISGEQNLDNLYHEKWQLGLAHHLDWGKDMTEHHAQAGPLAICRTHFNGIFQMMFSGKWLEVVVPFSEWCCLAVGPRKDPDGGAMKWCFVIGLAILRLARAPIPCKPTLAADVQVGDVYAQIGPSRTILHEEERDCAIVTFGYEGMIVITCIEGTLNVTTEGCSPRRCQPYQSITVRLGEYSVSASPLAIIASGGQETRQCRNLNPLFRNTYIMYCNYGEAADGDVTVDTSQCVTQWDPMTSPPWTRRSRVGTVGLSDGALLMLGGLGNEGPIREVWLWQPTLGTLEGSWHRSLKVPPWSGRFGSAAVRISSQDAQQEQVVLMGGNDNQNRGDVWRWLRHSAPIELSLESEATGSQEQDCVLESSQLLRCDASAGVSGRKWQISHYLEMSTEIHIDLLHSGGGGALPLGAAGVGAAVIVGVPESDLSRAIELDTCRQLFRAEGGRWSTTGCTGDQPPWARADQPAIRLGPNGGAMPGQLRHLRFVLERERQEVIMYSDDVIMVPAGAEPGQFGAGSSDRLTWNACSCGRRCSNLSHSILPRVWQLAPWWIHVKACRDYSNVQNGSLVCPNVQPPVSEMHLRVVELVVWPEASLEVRRVLAPAEYWQSGPCFALKDSEFPPPEDQIKKKRSLYLGSLSLNCAKLIGCKMPKPIGHAANILWQQAIQTERKAAVQWEDSWGFLRAERQDRAPGASGAPAHSSSAPSLRAAGQKVLETKVDTEGMSRSQALMGLRLNVPRDRFRKPASTQQELGWRQPLERGGLRFNYGLKHDDGIWPSL
eukprot:s3757_g5.t1